MGLEGEGVGKGCMNILSPSPCSLNGAVDADLAEEEEGRKEECKNSQHSSAKAGVRGAIMRSKVLAA